jgi:hypothetical protein
LVNNCLDRVINKDVVTESFEKTGISDKQNGKPDANVMLHRCRVDLDTDDISQIVHVMPKLKEKMMHHSFFQMIKTL